MLTTVDHPRAGTVRTPGVPLRLSETPTAIRRAAPLLGEHTVEVLRDLLGYGPDRIGALIGTGAVSAVDSVVAGSRGA